MSTNYRQRMIDFSLSLVGTKAPDKFFMERYYAHYFAKKYPDITDDDAQPPILIGSTSRFVTYCARMTGVPITVIPDIFELDAFVNQMYEKGYAHERLNNQETDDYLLTPGDLIVTYSGRIGIVTSINTDTNKMSVIEAYSQSNGAYNVWKKNYNCNSQLIAYYITPNYDVPESNSIVSNQTKLSRMVKPCYIAKFQLWMIDNADSKLKDWTISDVNGVVDAKFRHAVGTLFDNTAMPCIRPKATGDEVFLIQRLLYCHGYDPKGIDGIFGESTRAAVRSFQANRKLKPSGIVNSATWNSLVHHWNI